ncbi:Cell division inhibitor protein [Salinisphaera shabanensis E1L3A]|uniref:Cell division inhibitor protein n=1 Tax=Salinisphaera shabanensis E1L3A TaxID=1033802 RepID=U2ER16_9GAMM|nr:TIGR01777 family oxidoreductase [Salinisphaera shabanensis]ERJ20200.1 Cell division inhibitor protein [Salinisphaera shabanensis E1L3A]
MNKALVTGGTGFIGRHLCESLLADGWAVQVITRDTAAAAKVLPAGVVPVADIKTAAPADAVINLAGENLADGRWTEARKREMLESRLRITRELTEALGEWEDAPQVLVSGSAVGYYGARGDDVLDESEPPGDEFQSELCVAWEQAARRAEAASIRVCRVRTGIVLGAEDGALAQMITPFKFGLGGHFGTGTQYMPWIHIRDEVRAIRFLIDKRDCSGAFNLTAPEPATNREFTTTLARVLHRPNFAWVPGPALKLMVGEMAHLLLTGQRAVPSALEKAGFTFEFRRLQPALEDLLGDR